jgi:sec-independent protein translocase protein TatA
MNVTYSLLAMFTPSGMDMLIILAIMLLLFGNRLPSVMRNLGAGAREFKKGVQGIDEEMQEADKVVIKESDKAVAKDDKKE